MLLQGGKGLCPANELIVFSVILRIPTAREMVQWSRTLVSLAEDMDSVLRTHARRPTIACNASFRRI